MLWLALSLLLLLPLPAQTPSGWLADGTPDRTPYFVEDAGDGPCVLLVGGIHGNEPAGARAVAQIGSWQLRRGRLIRVPRANVRALAAGKRRTPGLPRSRSDLNRCFPAEEGQPARTPLAHDLWALVERERPDWILDCHEGFDFTQRNPKSVGSSIIICTEARTRRRALGMLRAVNRTIEAPDLRFVLKGPPVLGSLVRAAHERLGIPGMILETTKKAQRLPLRVRQHRTMVRAFLSDLGLVSGRLDRIFSRERLNLRVALYDGGGTGSSGPPAMERSLRGEEGIRMHRVDAVDVRAGRVEECDVFLVPGGSASKQARALGKAGRRVVRKHIAGGGGYLGHCAGAYLAATNYSWSLKILDAKVIDRAHWARGRGTARVELSPSGQALFGIRDQQPIGLRYANGPLLAPSGWDQLPDYEVLGRYRNEINRGGKAPEGVMLGTPAIVRARFRRGRVLLMSPHPEYTEGRRGMIVPALRWVAGWDEEARGAGD